MQEHIDDNELNLPDDLVRELKARDVSQPFVPATVDEAVLSRAREQFAGKTGSTSVTDGDELPATSGGRRTRSPAFWGRAALAGVGSVAAALALAALLTTDPLGIHTETQPDQNAEQFAIAPQATPQALSTESRTSGWADRSLKDAVVDSEAQEFADGNGAGAGVAPAEMAASEEKADKAWGLTQSRTSRADGVEADDLASAADTKRKLAFDGGSVGAMAKKSEAAMGRPADSAPASVGKDEDRERQQEQTGYRIDPADLNHSGAVDILDVYLLARQRELGNKAVTQASIDALAARVVSLVRVEGGPL